MVMISYIGFTYEYYAVAVVRKGLLVLCGAVRVHMLHMHG